MKHDCAWCRFNRWMFADISNVIATIALVIGGIFGLSALFIVIVMLLVDAFS